MPSSETLTGLCSKATLAKKILTKFFKNFDAIDYFYTVKVLLLG